MYAQNYDMYIMKIHPNIYMCMHMVRGGIRSCELLRKVI